MRKRQIGSTHNCTRATFITSAIRERVEQMRKEGAEERGTAWQACSRTRSSGEKLGTWRNRTQTAVDLDRLRVTSTNVNRDQSPGVGQIQKRTLSPPRSAAPSDARLDTGGRTESNRVESNLEPVLRRDGKKRVLVLLPERQVRSAAETRHGRLRPSLTNLPLQPLLPGHRSRVKHPSCHTCTSSASLCVFAAQLGDGKNQIYL